MKRAMILTVVVALVVALMAGTAVAKPGKGKGKAKAKAPAAAMVTYVFKGAVTGVAEDGSSITVEVTGGNNATKQLLGSQTFSVNGATKINVDDQEGASLDQIGEGYEVVVQSKAPAGTKSGFTALMISAETPEPVQTEPAA